MSRYKKTYSSPGKLIVTVKINDKNIDVKFDGPGLREGEKVFITKDKAIQEALEKSASFNQFFELLKKEVIEEAPEVKEEPKEVEVPENKVIAEEEQPSMVSKEDGEVLTLKEVETLPQAKKWLARELDVKVYPSMNKVKATSIAKEKGFELIIKK